MPVPFWPFYSQPIYSQAVIAEHDITLNVILFERADVPGGGGCTQAKRELVQSILRVERQESV